MSRLGSSSSLQQALGLQALPNQGRYITQTWGWHANAWPLHYHNSREQYNNTTHFEKPTYDQDFLLSSGKEEGQQVNPPLS